jgi:hypothetical protein
MALLTELKELDGMFRSINTSLLAELVDTFSGVQASTPKNS